MIVIGLTGSIGMGKSTIANMMRSLNIPVHDADEEVHKLLANDREVRAGLEAFFPPKKYPDIYEKNKINRKVLGGLVFEDAQKKHNLESLLHPRVRKAQNDFIRINREARRNIVALDIPLLFETGADKNVDITITASAPFTVQRSRVLARPSMNETKFYAIIDKQMPDGEKRVRADYVLETGIGRAHVMRTLQNIIAQLLQQNESLSCRKTNEKYYLYGC